MTKVPAMTINVGDTIMPPEREVRLWMRRTLAERNLPESALHMKVVEIHQGHQDKIGPWLVIKADYSDAWNEGRKGAIAKSYPMTFKVRPTSLWEVVEKWDWENDLGGVLHGI